MLFFNYSLSLAAEYRIKIFTTYYDMIIRDMEKYSCEYKLIKHILKDPQKKKYTNEVYRSIVGAPFYDYVTSNNIKESNVSCLIKNRSRFKSTIYIPFAEEAGDSWFDLAIRNIFIKMEERNPGVEYTVTRDTFPVLMDIISDMGIYADTISIQTTNGYAKYITIDNKKYDILSVNNVFYILYADIIIALILKKKFGYDVVSDIGHINIPVYTRAYFRTEEGYVAFDRHNMYIRTYKDLLFSRYSFNELRDLGNDYMFNLLSSYLGTSDPALYEVENYIEHTVFKRK